MRILITGIFLAITLPLMSSAAFAECDYTDAENNKGFGYDSDAGLSCPPEDSTNFCDYTDASQNDGFGYNHFTGESCAPRANLPMLSVYTNTNSQFTDVSTDSTFIRVSEAYCDAGDIVTGGGCSLMPAQPPLPGDHGWRIVQTIPSSIAEGWNCSIMCTGKLNADGTRDSSMCLDTQFNVRAMCLKQQ